MSLMATCVLVSFGVVKLGSIVTPLTHTVTVD